MKQDQVWVQMKSQKSLISSNPLFAQIGKSFCQSKNGKNKLIFTSKSIPLVQPLAYSLLEMIQQSSTFAQELILLLDFELEDIQRLNECLTMITLTSPLGNKFDERTRKLLKITRLNQLTIQKRRPCYIKNGVYAVSCQIFLTDLLRGEDIVQPRHISKIIVKLNQKIKNYYHYYAWLCTMIKIKEENNNNKWTVPFFFVCNKPSYYSFQEDLKEVYRDLFCEKVIIWPFGRAQIHKKLNVFRQKKNIKEWQHSLSHSEGEKQIQEVLLSIFKFLKKIHGIKYRNESKQIEELLYSRIDEQSFLATRTQNMEFEGIKSLLSQLENINKCQILKSIAAFRENQYDLWNSNNSQAILLTQTLIEHLKNGIFWFQRCEPFKIDLKSLLQSKHSFQGQNQSQYQCFYHPEIKLILKADQNEKISELIKVIEDLKNQRNQKQESCTHLMNQKEKNIQSAQQEQWVQLQKKLKVDKENQQNKKTILVMCNSKRTLGYISQTLRSYLSDCYYLEYLFSLQSWLQSESPKRQIIIKKMFEKRKVLQEQQKVAEVKGTPKQKTQDSKIILQETLLNQIEQLAEFIQDYELQLDNLNQQFNRAISTGVIFDINLEQIKLIQKFNEKLANKNFKMIDNQRIKLRQGRKRRGNILFEGGEVNLKVVVEYFGENSEVTRFYSLLQVIDPEVIVFYSPTTTLLRSLYLYCAQNETLNLQNLHIMNYQDSYESKVVKEETIKEDKAFWEITQKRSQLTSFQESPFLRIKNLNLKDKYEKAIHSMGGKSMLRNEEQNSSFSLTSINFTQQRRVVIVDTREFKSSLPSYLFHFGFQVIPMFLKTGDYILSDDIAVQKKSVNTKDFQTSLNTQRLEQQVKRMNTTFKHSYVLIQFQEEKDVRKENFSRLQFGKGSRQNSEGRELRKKIFQLISKYDKVRLLWSTSIQQSCHYFKLLKADKPEPNLLKFQKAESQEEVPSQKLFNISEVSSCKQKDY